jgi:NADPH-dependent 2,4-dienoyl-CoA reductase/sulfur reductase-like enzyme
VDAPRFVRLAERDRASIVLTIDGATATALAGDTVLVALLTHGRRVRDSEFGDGPRAGFCLMGACQDCWVWTDAGERLRACSTPVVAGMALRTSPPATLCPMPPHLQSPLDGAGVGVGNGLGVGEGAVSAAAPRIVIVGAGPAGVRAAQACVAVGMRPVVVDESPREGGQAYRLPPAGFTRSSATLYGSEAAKADALHAAFEALRPHIEHWPQTLAWNLTEGALHVVRGEQPATLPFDAVVICSGATDRLMPVPGWQQAGCYSLGAAQVALMAQGCAIGPRTVFLGSGPLLYLVATQYLQAGAQVVAVLDTAPALKSWPAVQGLLARPIVSKRGLGLIVTLLRGGVKLLQGVTPLRIEGDEGQGVRRVIVKDARGRERGFDTDAVALGWHLRAEAQLADLAGCEFEFEPLSRQWLPRVDAEGRSSVRGVYLAGDGARLLGADGAETAGRLAALTALADLQHAGGLARQGESPILRMRLASMERFRVGLAHAFPWPHDVAAAVPDDTVVCRCEAITAGELRRCVTELGGQEINRAKAFSRVGMGRCQGRYCAHAAAEIVASAAGVPIERVGRLRAQAPVKPLILATREVERG